MIVPAKRNHWRAEDFPEGTEGLRLVRMVGDDLRTFECMFFERGAAGIAWFLNRWFIHGDRIVSEGEDYGLADVIGNEGWTILDEIPLDREGFQRARVKLGCRVDSPDLLAAGGEGR